MEKEFENLKFLDSGACSDAYLTEDNRVLLVGKREDSFSLYQSLFNKTRLIDGKISSVKITDNPELIQPNSKYPFGAMLQNFVDGKTLKNKIDELSNVEKEDIGKSLVNFFQEMQSIDCDLNKDDEIKINLAKLEKSLNLLKEYVCKEDFNKFLKVYKNYEEFMRQSEFCLTHGDLQEANILIGEDNKLSGIIDFGNMEYYVKEVEFAPMMGYDDIIFNSMLNHYNKKVDVKNIYLVKLVRQIRHFKHVVHLGEDLILKEVNKITLLLNNIYN